MIGLTYQVDFTTFKQLLNKIFKNQKIEIEKKSVKEVSDSEVLPDYIQFEDKKNEKEEKKKTTVKQNDQAVPTDD